MVYFCEGDYKTSDIGIKTTGQLFKTNRLHLA